MSAPAVATHELLRIDARQETERLCAWLRETVVNRFKRRGVVVGISGGIDSSVVAALCVRALGPARVLGLLMPESDSSGDSARLAGLLAEKLGIRTELENIAPVLSAAGCYSRRDDAIRTVVPEYGSGYKSKIVLPNLLNSSALPIFSVVVQSPSGETKKVRLPLDAYLTIVAATNFKQRARKMMEYYHADRLNFVVAGTPNRLEYQLGFFVKNGDGASDVKPIAHLYKSQVYQLAEFLSVPEEIQRRPPTTDTYSLEQTQEEFYFAMPLAMLDVCLFGKNRGMAPEELAAVSGLDKHQVANAYASIASKQKFATYLGAPPATIDSF
jgi:NAD+ synthase